MGAEDASLARNGTVTGSGGCHFSEGSISKVCELFEGS
jgi:hypothetical protein